MCLIKLNFSPFNLTTLKNKLAPLMITLLATLLIKLTILRTKLAILLIKMTTPMNELAILLVELTTELIRTMVFHLRGVCHQSFGDPSDSFDGFEFDWIINCFIVYNTHQ